MRRVSARTGRLCCWIKCARRIPERTPAAWSTANGKYLPSGSGSTRKPEANGPSRRRRAISRAAFGSLPAAGWNWTVKWLSSGKRRRNWPIRTCFGARYNGVLLFRHVSRSVKKHPPLDRLGRQRVEWIVCGCTRFRRAGHPQSAATGADNGIGSGQLQLCRAEWEQGADGDPFPRPCSG